MTTTCPKCGKVGQKGSMATHMRSCNNPEYRAQRFWAKVDKSAGPDGCWPWTGAKNSWGYGTFSMSPGKNINASRAAWILTNGPIPEGQDVLHDCDFKLCCNTSHQYLGTDVENGRDRSERGQAARGERAWNANLTDEQAREIWRRLAAGEHPRDIAKDFPTRENNIYSMRAGRTWRHLAPPELREALEAE